jgi:DNA-binding phage protein
MASNSAALFNSIMRPSLRIGANYYPGIIITSMVRTPLSTSERERGERLGLLLREARGTRSMVEVAAEAGISVETLRKIERGRVPTPAFFTVAAVAGAVGVSLDTLSAGAATHPAATAGTPAA